MGVQRPWETPEATHSWLTQKRGSHGRVPEKSWGLRPNDCGSATREALWGELRRWKVKDCKLRAKWKVMWWPLTRRLHCCETHPWWQLSNSGLISTAELHCQWQIKHTTSLVFWYFSVMKALGRRSRTLGTGCVEICSQCSDCWVTLIKCLGSSYCSEEKCGFALALDYWIIIHSIWRWKTTFRI